MELLFVDQSTIDKHLKLSYQNKHDSRQFLADALRLNTLSMIMQAGSGHIGSSFSAMDLVLGVYLDLVLPEGKTNLKAKYISSKGHDAPGLYSVLIAFGIIDEKNQMKLRRIDGLPGHPDISTPGIYANTGSLGMGISKAKGFIEANRIRQIDEPVIVLTGDGELQEGQIWESLASAKNRELRGLLVFVDHNKIQSDTWVERVSDLGDIESKFKSFGWNVKRIDGHDSASISRTINEWKGEKLPTIIIADTVKGKGCSFMENFPKADDFYKFHSGAPTEADYNNACTELLDKLDKIDSHLKINRLEKTDRKPQAGESFLENWKWELVNSGKLDKNLIVLDADLTLDTGTYEFAKTFPDRYIQCGIAEQDMVSIAGGLALSGSLPVVHSFASFISSRAHEQIITNSTEKSKVFYVGALAGLIPGGPGHSHQAVADVNSFNSVHNILIFEPCHPKQLDGLISNQLVHHDGPAYIRFTSVPLNYQSDVIPEARIPVGEGSVLKSGHSQCLILVGGLPTSIISGNFSDFEGLETKILCTPWINRINSNWYLEKLKNVDHVVIVQNFNLNSGFELLFTKFLVENSLPIRMSTLGVNGVPKSGTNLEVLEYHGFTVENIKRLLSSKNFKDFGKI